MSEEKNINIKQRIIGALVLVSLGIIIIPMLLNGGATSSQSISGENIPPVPKELKKVLPKVPQPIVMPAAKTVKAYPERTSSNSKKLVEKSTTTEPNKVIEAKSEAVHSESVTQPKYKKAKKPTSTKIDTAYTLQIASFSKKSNAESLQNKLRKKTYKAYIESILTSKGRIYRLRVGPYLNFDQISRQKNKIEKEFKLKNTAIIKY
ncbi:MAG: SPOR domain-containing protein [Gammaproteobacteria bacterium]|nr:SPOR domain-containing protein [Gammaproteobacteria bacterium]